MSETSCRQELFDTLSGVAGIGKVYDFERWCADWNTFLNLFKNDDGRILGWEISRKSGVGSYLNQVEEEIDHVFEIHGYLPVNDAGQSEKVFNALIEDVRAAFRTAMTLGGLNSYPQGFRVGTIDTRMFGNVLCHYCEITIPVREYQS